jgi:hypothetical protein
MISCRITSLLDARSLLLAGCVALAATGCKKDAPPAEKKTEEAKAPTTEKKDTSRSKARDEGVEVPTEEDFEAEVEKQITASSDLSKELDLLEKQIQGQ